MTEESIIKSYNEGINAVISLVKDLNHDFVIQMGSLTSEINALKIANLEFSTRIAELEVRLNKNSNNSSMLIIRAQNWSYSYYLSASVGGNFYVSMLFK
ncbi:MAG: hypothetical protein ACYCVD_13640 [Desulfitobacteriaceae bacterium]